MKTLRLGALFILLMSTQYSMNQCYSNNTYGGGSVDEAENSVISVDPLSDKVEEAILFMREEEKVARDVYLYLYEIYPLRPFANISKSEQVHMDAILYLIDLYGLDDPAEDKPQGEFSNEELQTLYNALILKGSESKTEALKVGALIEEVDIIDLQNALKEAGSSDEISRVYTNLCNASKNHLRAYVRVLSMNGVEYEPVKLDNETFLSIINN